jgi:hypothetical protein
MEDSTISRSTVSRLKLPKRVTAHIDLRGEKFTFKLFTRRVPLGDYGIIDYFWMDVSELRNLGSEFSSANFRNCVALWKAVMKDSNLWDDDDQQVNYILAQCYPLVCRSKGMQKIYRDAFLDSGQTDYNPTGLPEEVRQRIKQVVEARDRFQLKQELDQVLGRFEPPAKLLPALQEAFRRWVGYGLCLMKQRGRAGLTEFLTELNTWLKRLRKKGGNPWVRRFIDMFAYEAKASFYVCYASAWIALVPWLKEHRGLDQLSERFLRLWHHQNQAIEIPPGRTPGELYYPTDGQAIGYPSLDTAAAARQVLTWQTAYSKPLFIPDVFSGQVLALHPVSSVFMKDAALCAIAGRFLTSESYDVVMSRGRSANYPLYWDFVGAILTAAHSYRQALDVQAQNRGVWLRGGDAAKSLACVSDPQESSQANLLEDFAVDQGIFCPKCDGDLSLEAWSPATQKSDHFSVQYRCRTCQRAAPIRIERSVFQDWLLSND